MTLRLFPRREETIAGAAEALRAGRTTCVGLVERCLAAIDEWEPKVRAWVVVDRSGAIEQARALDDELARGEDRGPLHGIPVGVKDIIDVEGFVTRAGAGRWSLVPAVADAEPVATFRLMGAVILGKTVTTPYAFIDPPPTRNPWDLGRTPGGSSSGSAAAVATGMCLAAIGSQTAGSLTRPASFCGIASWKPASWSREPVAGIVPLAPSLDTVGSMARTVADLAMIQEALIDEAAGEPVGPPRFARLRGFFDERAEPPIRSALDRAAAAWCSAGAEIVDLPCPGHFERTLIGLRTIMAAEVAALHARRFSEDVEDYPPRFADLIGEGQLVKATDYVRALYFRTEMLAALGDMLDPSIDALLVPATTGPAPGAETTGDPAFNAPWNYLNLETLSMPIGLSPDGLPLAAQLIGPPDDSTRLFDAAVWCERLLHRLDGRKGD
ncbi:MAG TPA: amidase [Isosphaeraceae bacterium]|jgi:aspartyl-tRNA(Asn)/glutamyl-tRNA(Gln) amidotransferase subunit A|nr:amidase [Isosphaeraceae bacterium]